MATDKPHNKYKSETCICPWEFKRTPGLLYGISMMPCWVRLIDAPDCPDHGSDYEIVNA